MQEWSLLFWAHLEVQGVDIIIGGQGLSSRDVGDCSVTETDEASDNGLHLGLQRVAPCQALQAAETFSGSA